MEQCPLCGSPDVRLVEEEAESNWGEKYQVTHKYKMRKCFSCGEGFFNPQEMREIQLNMRKLIEEKYGVYPLTRSEEFAIRCWEYSW